MAFRILQFIHDLDSVVYVGYIVYYCHKKQFYQNKLEHYNQMKYFLTVIQNYLNIKGRASRSEYWYFVLFQVLISLIAIGIDYSQDLFILYNEFIGPFFLAFYLWTAIPGFTVSVRRLHDAGKSGWFLLVSLIPLIGPFWLLMVLCKESEQGDNQYGIQP